LSVASTSGFMGHMWNLVGAPPQADPQFRSVSASVVIPAQGNGSVNVTKPAGTVDGDYVFIVCLTGNDAGVANVAPAGFTLLQVIDNGAFNSGVKVFGKVASSEGASWSLTEGVSNSQSNAFAITYSNENAVPINAIVASAQQNGTTAPAFSALTTTLVGKLIGIALEYNNRAATITAAGSMTSRIAVNGARSYALFDEDIATIGSISGRTATSSVSGDFYTVSILLAAEAPPASASFSGNVSTINFTGGASAVSQTSLAGSVSPINFNGAVGTNLVVRRIVSLPITSVGGILFANQTGITVYVNALSGGLIATFTGETTDASGIMELSSALFVLGTEYVVRGVMSDGVTEFYARKVAEV
jgi:hypothetical protein